MREFQKLFAREYMTTDARIKNIVAALDNNWFISKKNAFLKRCDPGKQCFYATSKRENDDLDKYVKTELALDITIGDFKTVGSSIEDILRIDLEKYCYCIEYSENGNSGEDAANSIIQIIEEIIAGGLPAPGTINKLIKHIENVISEQIKELSKEHSKKKYNNALSYFEENCNNKIHNHFHHNIKGKELLEMLDQNQPDVSVNKIAELKKEAPTKANSKPIFREDVKKQIFDILKDFFEKSNHKKLRSIIDTGNSAESKLHFMDNGNRLADFFKQLYDSDIITGCNKKELQKWIERSFTYQHRGEVKDYKIRYLEDTISTKWNKCETPIISVVQSKATGHYSITKS